jgi:hypothetical protein
MYRFATALVLTFFAIAAWSQSPPNGKLRPATPSVLAPSAELITMRGTIIAYDWSTRYYMEGARVENFVFRSEGNNPQFIRVVLLWHPADSRKILPKNFYSLGKVWKLALNTTSPYDFVRQYCIMQDASTFVVDVGDGKKAKLQRFLSPAVLPPEIDLPTNFKTALAKRPASPDMPDTTSMQCMYLQKVSTAAR